MWKNMVFQAKKQLGENISYYAAAAAVLLAGALVAVLYACSATELTQKELLLYFNEFFTSFMQSGVEQAEIFRLSLRANAVLFAALFLVSTTVVGIPLVAIIGLASGFSAGFAVASLFQMYGVKAFLLFLCAFLPHALLALPCLLIVLANGFRFSASLFYDRFDLKRRLWRYFTGILAVFVVMLGGILMQAYIEPILMKSVAGYFLPV